MRRPVRRSFEPAKPANHKMTMKNISLVQPYLNFDGRCEEAIEFYRGALGAETVMLLRFKDNPEPPQPGCVTPATETIVMNAEIRIGETAVIGFHAPYPDDTTH